jgi:hypothetical protein
VLKPVRHRNQYRRLLRSTDVAIDFSVSLDYSLTSQSVRSLQVPPNNTNSQPSQTRPQRRDLFRAAPLPAITLAILEVKDDQQQQTKLHRFSQRQPDTYGQLAAGIASQISQRPSKRASRRKEEKKHQ